MNEDIRGRQATMNLVLFILPEYIVRYVTLFSILAMLQEKNTSCFTHPLTEYMDEFLYRVQNVGLTEVRSFCQSEVSDCCRESQLKIHLLSPIYVLTQDVLGQYRGFY